MKKVSHQQLKDLIKHLATKSDGRGRKVPLLCMGTIGIGKSAVGYQASKELCEELAEKIGKRKFVSWNETTNEEKEQIISNPKEYYTFSDWRLSEFDSSDLKGVPFPTKDGKNVEWINTIWAKYISHPDSAGTIFFDELNLATPLVISSCYKILYDRVIGESKIGDNWVIIGCGNKEDDRCHTMELASAVRDRGCEVELVSPTGDDWIAWAIQNNFDSRIIGFISYKPTNLHKVDYESDMKYTTERGWERMNILIKGETDISTLELVGGSAIGEGIAREFIAFCKIQDSVKLEEIIKNPELLAKIKEISIKYFVVSALAEKYKDKKINFSDVIALSQVLDREGNAEFVTLMWRLCVRYSPDRFKKDYLAKEKSDDEKKLKQKYNKYLI